MIEWLVLLSWSGWCTEDHMVISERIKRAGVDPAKNRGKVFVKSILL